MPRFELRGLLRQLRWLATTHVSAVKPKQLSVCRLKLPFNRNLFKISLFNFRIFPHSQEWAFLEILPSEYRLKSLFVLQFNRDRIYHGNFDF